jgi:hypothetical protein
MTGEGGGVCHDDAIADQAVVRDVRLRHNQAIIARFSQHSAAGSTPMNRNKLAYLVSPADVRFRRFAFVLEILRSQSDGYKRKDVSAVAD